MTTALVGRSRRSWTIQRFQVRRGHLRPHDGVRAQQVDLVCDARGSTFGALRSFADRAERAEALTFLGAAGHVAPVLLDIVDAATAPPAIVTAWAPGRFDRALSQLHTPDDLLTQLEGGHRWQPAEALRLLVPLGDALDRLAKRGFVPVELSPDHLVENGGGIRLVGIGRHLYRPHKRRAPGPEGMSLATTQLLAGDLPQPSASQREWRDFQARLLVRLAGWMCGGLPPGSWGEVGRHQADFLAESGFSSDPVLVPGRLAATLDAAARAERETAARRRVTGASCVLFYNEPACNGTRETREAWQQRLLGTRLEATVIEVKQHLVRVQIQARSETWQVSVHWKQTPHASGRGYVDLTALYTVGEQVTVILSQVKPPVAEIVYGYGERPPEREQRPKVVINPEAVRLGLLEEHGPEVLAVAALGPNRQASTLAALLSGAGWVLVERDELVGIAGSVMSRVPGARRVIAGRAGPELEQALKGSGEQVLPGAAVGPSVAGRAAAALPYVDDPELRGFSAELLFEQGGSSLKRRTFPAGWALKLNADAFTDKRTRAARDKGRVLRSELVTYNTLYGADTELLLRVAEVCGRPGLRGIAWNKLNARLKRAAPVLLGMPAKGALRNDLIHALLATTTDSLDSDVTRRLLPVAPRLSEVYEPDLELGGVALNELLYQRDGIRRLGLLGRLATALPAEPIDGLLDAVAALDQQQVDALLDVPAPSLQYLVGRLGSQQLFTALAPFIEGPDLDLLGRYTPTAWRLLLEGLRQPEHLSVLGLGWALVVEADPVGVVDARVLLDIARQAGAEARLAVRALLQTPTDQWGVVLGHPTAAAAWLREFGRLDLGPVLAAFPDLESLTSTFSAAGLRAAAAARLTRPALDVLAAYAAEAGVAAGEAVTTFLDLGGEVPDLEHLKGPAPGAWTAGHLAAGGSLAEAMVRLIEEPGLLRTWLVDGERLGSRVLTGVLRADPRSLGIDRTEGLGLVELLEARPGLLTLVNGLLFPRERLELLRLAAAHPDLDLATRSVADALPTLLDQPDADELLVLMLTEHLTAEQAWDAIEGGLSPADRASLREFGPLRPTPDLLALARDQGPALARTVAIGAQHNPRLPELVLAWGPAWLPVLVGPDGRAVTQVLSGQGKPSPGESSWLLAAGTPGMAALAAHGPCLWSFVHETGAPPRDATLLDELLRLGGDPRSYNLITEYGLPRLTWPRVIAHADRPVEDLLLTLWSRDGFEPVRS